MKYSFLFPYYKRPEIRITLLSFLHHYKDRSDYEVVIAEDKRSHDSFEDHKRLKEIIDEFKDKISITLVLDETLSYNSARKYNLAFKHSVGSYIITSNPECAHETNILSGLDEQFDKNQNVYVVCSCKAVNMTSPIDVNTFAETKYKMKQWYQHSGSNNRKFHFCSSMSRINYIKTGFDERYCGGIAYEDNSFLKRIESRQIPIVVKDDLVSVHIEHPRSYTDPKTQAKLVKINEELYKNQCAVGNFFDGPLLVNRNTVKQHQGRYIPKTVDSHFESIVIANPDVPFERGVIRRMVRK